METEILKYMTDTLMKTGKYPSRKEISEKLLKCPPERYNRGGKQALEYYLNKLKKSGFVKQIESYEVTQKGRYKLKSQKHESQNKRYNLRTAD